MKAPVTLFALQLALAAGSTLAKASELELDFPDADENGYEEVATPAPAKHLVAAPVEVRLIPMPAKGKLVAAPVEVRLIPMPARGQQKLVAAPVEVRLIPMPAASAPAPAPAPAPATELANADDGND